MKKKILILGASGFIGGRLVQECIKKKWKVYYGAKNKKNFKKHDNLIFCKIDLLKHNFNSIKKIKVDYVIFAAGYVNHSLLLDKKKEILNEHFFSLIKIIDILKNSNIKKFIYLGSADEYGNQKSPLKEDLLEFSKTSYTLAKTLASKYLLAMNKMYNFPSVILRVFLVYGPFQKKRFIPNVILNCLRNKKFLLTSCLQKKDFLFIDDFIEAIFLTLKSNKASGEDINIAYGKSFSLKKIVIFIKKKLRGGKPIFGARKIEKRENLDQYACIIKAKKLINWYPKTNLHKGLNATINSYKYGKKSFS